MAPPTIASDPHFELCMLVTQLRNHEKDGADGMTFKEYMDKRKSLQTLVDNHLTLHKMMRLKNAYSL